MVKGVKFRAYPNKEQQNLINRTLGCSRMIYNKGLSMRNIAYAAGDKIGYNQTSSMLTELKKQEDYAFLKEVDSIALQQSLRDLDRGFKNFFAKCAAHPRFKSKHDHHQSYRTMNQSNNIRITGRYIKLPKLGYIKIRQSMEIGHINHVTIERTPTGKYFVILNVDFDPELRPNAGGKIGIDVGIKAFYSDSNGNTVSNPKYLEKSARKLIREQRNDFLQKQSTMLVRENQTICIEDLHIKGMLRNHRLARSLSSVSWASFFSMLEYKASWYGNEIIKVPTMYPSSQTCSCCGYKNPLVKNLTVRRWKCPACHAVHDRDINAGLNIMNKGLQMHSA